MGHQTCICSIQTHVISFYHFLYHDLVMTFGGHVIATGDYARVTEIGDYVHESVNGDHALYPDHDHDGIGNVSLPVNVIFYDFRD